MFILYIMTKKNAINTFLLVLFYSIGFFILQFFLHKIGMVSAVPDVANIGHFDAGVYHDVAQRGYVFTDPQANNTGVYILYPWLCGLLHLNFPGMVVLNILMLCIGFTIFVQQYPVPIAEQLIWLSTPSLFFMYVPYTEALFFVLVAIAFYAIKNSKWWLVWISLFLLSLTRATAVFLIPSLLVMELLANNRKDWLRSVGVYIIRYALPVLLGLFFFVWYQYHVTGDWFRYFHQQRQWEGHTFSLPKFPLVGLDAGDHAIWLSAMAVLVCLVAMILAIKKALEWLFKDRVQEDKLFTLSLCYLPAILFIILFSNPKWGAGTTIVEGLHRYTLCTPFFFVFLYHTVSKERKYTVGQFVFMLFLCNITWLSCGSYKHIMYLLFFNVNTAVVFAYMLHANKKIQWPQLVIVAFNVIVQVALFQQFIMNIYPE